MSAIANHPYIRRTSRSWFTVSDPTGASPDFALHAGQVRGILSFNRKLQRNGRFSDSSPGAYVEFSNIYNAAPGVTSKFATIVGGEIVAGTNGPGLSAEAFKVEYTDILDIPDIKDALLKKGFHLLDQSEGALYQKMLREKAGSGLWDSEQAAARRERERKRDLDEYISDAQQHFRTQGRSRKRHNRGGRVGRTGTGVHVGAADWTQEEMDAFDEELAAVHPLQPAAMATLPHTPAPGPIITNPYAQSNQRDVDHVMGESSQSAVAASTAAGHLSDADAEGEDDEGAVSLGEEETAVEGTGKGKKRGTRGRK